MFLRPNFHQIVFRERCRFAIAGKFVCWTLCVVGVQICLLVFTATIHTEVSPHHSELSRVTPEHPEEPNSSHSTSSNFIHATLQSNIGLTDTIRSNRQATNVVNRGKPARSDELYLVLDLSVNLLFVQQGERTLYTALASTGSKKVLQDPHYPSRRWKFETPRGMFTIVSKLVDPVWIKPDWAFIEEGQSVPRDRKSRLQPGVLGKYALGFGNSYFIHGTLYTNLLGANITHGCIQLSDEDLRYVFRTVPLGASLFIM